MWQCQVTVSIFISLQFAMCQRLSCTRQLCVIHFHSRGEREREMETWYCRDRVSSCNIYAVQQDTQSFLMIEFIHHMLARHISDLTGPSSGAFYKLYLEIWYVVIRVLLDTSSRITYISSTCFGPHRSIFRSFLQTVFADLVRLLPHTISANTGDRDVNRNDNGFAVINGDFQTVCRDHA